MAIALKDRAIHEKCFNSPDISKSDSCCLHINLPAFDCATPRLNWRGRIVCVWGGA